MTSWTSAALELFWRNALAAIPLAFLVAGACRVFPCRPTTRHALWAMILLFLVVPPLLPGLPLPDAASAPVKSVEPARSVVEGIERADGDSPSPKSPSVPLGEVPQVVPEVASAEPSAVERIQLPPRDRVGRRLDRRSESTGYPPKPSCSARAAARALPRRPDRLAPPRGSLGPLSSPIKESTPASEVVIIENVPPEAEKAVVADAAGTRDQSPAPIVLSAPPDETLRTSEDLRGPYVASKRAGETAEDLESAVAGEQASDTLSPLRPWLAGLAAIREAVAGLPPIPVGAWLGGIVVVVAVCVLRVVGFRRRIRAALPAPAMVQRMVSIMAKRLGLKRAPETLMVAGRMSPMIWVGRRTRLILPADLWSQLDRVGRQAIVCHELAHLRRRDHWVCFGEQLVAILYWWHPLVWWVRHRLREEAEFCCDAWVTWLMPRHRRAYAEALLRARQYVSEENCAVPAVGIGVTTGRARRFTRRLTMVMTQSVKPRVSALGLVLVLAMAATGWLTSPAQSCPPKEKSVKAGKASTAVTVPAPCKDAKAGAPCKHRKPCKPCKPDKRSKAGTAEPSAFTAVGVPDVGYVLPVAPYAPNTYEQHVAKGWAQGVGSYGHGVAGVLGGVYEPMFALPALSSGYGEGDDRSVEERLDRLEKRLEKLMRRLEGSAHVSVPQPPKPARMPAPKLAPPRKPVTAPVPDPLAFSVGKSAGEQITRAYKLPEGKLKDLTGLMVRSDVPVLVRPQEDCIEVIATEAQHVVFKGFVDMINESKETEERAYELPKGKLDALTKLMIRSDVPVPVQPSEDHIKVHGTGVEQVVFKAFVDLIHPSCAGRTTTSTSQALESYRKAREGGTATTLMKSFQKETKRKAREHAKEGKRRDREHKRLRREVERAQRQLQQQRSAGSGVEALLHEATLVLGEEEAGDLRGRLETLAKGKRLEALLENVDEVMKSVDPDTLEENARVLEMQARVLEANAEALNQQARALEQRAEELEEQADVLEEHAEELEEQAETLEERADELEEEADEIGLESHTRGMQQEAVSLLVEATALETEIESLDHEADSLIDEATSFEHEGDALEAKAEALAELAEFVLDVVSEIEENLHESSGI